jgi:hypothetical protein
MDYAKIVQSNGYDFFSTMNCAFAKKKKKSLGIMKTVNQFLKPLGIKIANI